MSILRTQSFLFTPALLIPLISTVIPFSQALLVNSVPQSTSSPSPALVNDVVYSMNHPSTITMELSSFLFSPLPTSQSATIEGEALRAVRVDVSGRDDVVPSASDHSTTSLSGFDSSTVQPPPSVSTLLLSSTLPASPESSTATSHDSPVPLSAIVGGAVGGCVVLVAFITFIFVTRRQRSPHIEPFTLQPDVERHQPGEDRRLQMGQHCPPASSDVPIIRPPIRRQGHPPSARPLFHSGPNVPALYDLKVSPSTTSLHSTLAPSTRSGRTFPHNRDGDAASVVSHASSHQRRHRPLPRPPTDKPPLPPVPVPMRPLVIRRAANKHNHDPNATTTHAANAQNHALAIPVPGGQSLASSAPLGSPVSPLDIDLGYYANPSTSPRTLSPARRDSLLEPSLVPVRSPRSLPAPPVPVPSPPVARNATVAVASRGAGRDGEAEGEEAAPDAGDNAGPYFSPSFDAEGRPDSPSVTKMYAELLELQRQVARLREDMPCGARHSFGHGELEAPPEYAESVVGSVVGSTVCV